MFQKAQKSFMDETSDNRLINEVVTLKSYSYISDFPNCCDNTRRHTDFILRNILSDIFFSCLLVAGKRKINRILLSRTMK